MAYTVQIAEHIAEVDHEWDVVVRDTDAPVFYYRQFLEAFEKHPIHPLERAAYLTVRAPNGTAVAVLPAYLQCGTDPMRVLATHFPEELNRPALLSHIWHSYESTLPTCPEHDPGAVHAALRALGDLAADWKAAVCGLVNVDQIDPLSTVLAEQDYPGATIETGWRMRMDGFKDVEGWLATLRHNPRRIMRAELRRAAETGFTTRRLSVQDADIDGFMRLARHTATKHDNADYYQQGIFPEFLRHLGEYVDVLELRGSRGELVGSAVLLSDTTRTHFPFCGFDLDACPNFSPFYVLAANVVLETIRKQREWLYLGRRNPDFKRRYGFTSSPLQAHLRRIGPS
ncbi:GNAT family N-acetyltransferase [Sciscionella sediminilitoris]|uniref:GNAT family N-acetyltransferase n=1 Tax=Sciscionella sediminilitoris TaxID=1445613 RepID=UPI0004DF9820|nr:GNAT family N-acetyltransferase [Sciscionella sp. SE31]